MLFSVVTVFCGLSVVYGQTPPLPMVVDPNCIDKLDSCSSFPDSACQDPYKEWAQLNCRQRCKFCVGPSTQAPPCVDTLKNCKDYGQSVCSLTEYKTWVNKNCRAYCKRCTAEQLQQLTTTTTTIAPIGSTVHMANVVIKETYDTFQKVKILNNNCISDAAVDCYDRVDCRTYGTNACAKSFEDWSKDNCPLTCGYCRATPTTPPVCEDRIPNCKAYSSDTCTDPDFQIWVEDNCKKYCGLC